MQTNKPMLPVGIDQFDKLIQSGFYYVDKTQLIEQLLYNWGEVNLFTRPRRFGKTLNMSMLKCFFEIGTDKSLFDHLYISNNKELCDKFMAQYPVIFISLKGVDGLSFEEAKSMLEITIRTEAQRHYELKTSEQISIENHRLLDDILSGRSIKIEDSLRWLSQILFEHYRKKSIILIDEYDVPLDKAFQHGYYKEMVSLLRGMFGQALKTNEFLQFAVVTGCLRVSKESIFTGLNNFKVLSIADVRFDEQFGFTDHEVKKILKDYDMQDHFQEVKEWYDGYHFGNADIYCPWDVINYVEHLQYDPKAEPEAYWINSSGNDLVKRFVDKADQTTKDEDRMNGLYQAIALGKAEEIQMQLTQILGQMISILDTKARNEEKENFYHGLMFGLLRNHRKWVVKSNVETGDGFADILLKPEDPDDGIIIELKYSKTLDGLEKACENAIAQIKDRRYEEILREEGRNKILAYGIAFCKKRCKVVVKNL